MKAILQISESDRGVLRLLDAEEREAVLQEAIDAIRSDFAALLQPTPSPELAPRKVAVSPPPLPADALRPRKAPAAVESAPRSEPPLPAFEPMQDLNSAQLALFEPAEREAIEEQLWERARSVAAAREGEEAAWQDAIERARVAPRVAPRSSAPRRRTAIPPAPSRSGGGFASSFRANYGGARR